jgi:hypothetical protein
MPHFENIDQYEAKNPKSGEKEIIPIAPHSMQAVDYRLTKSKASEAPRKEPKPAFAPVEFDPISVRQMEKEFKQAARADARRHPRSGLKDQLKKLKAFIASLFGKKEEKPARRSRPQHRKPGPRPPRKSGNKEKDGPGNTTTRDRPPRRNRRSRNRPKGGEHAGAHPDHKDGPKDGPRDKPSGKKRSNRPRRGRRPPNRQNQGPGKDNRNPKSGN